MLRTAAKCIIQARNFVKNNNSNSKNFIQRSYHFLHRQHGRSTNNMQMGATPRVAQRLSTFHQSTNGSNEFLPLAGITLVGAASLFGYNYTNNTLMEEEVKIEETKGDSSNEPTRMYTRDEIDTMLENDRIVVYYKCGVYDVTDFSGHPGGVGRLKMAAGGDLAVYWTAYTQHNRGHIVDYWLKNYKIGLVSEETMKEITDETFYDKDAVYGNEPKPYPIASSCDHNTRQMDISYET